MKRLKIGSASIVAQGIRVYMNIGSWRSMQKVREAMGRWLPDLPTWKSEDHWVEKRGYRNSFKWDGEYTLLLPIEARNDVAQLLRFR